MLWYLTCASLAIFSLGDLNRAPLATGLPTTDSSNSNPMLLILYVLKVRGPLWSALVTLPVLMPLVMILLQSSVNVGVTIFHSSILCSLILILCARIWAVAR